MARHDNARIFDRTLTAHERKQAGRAKASAVSRCVAGLTDHFADVSRRAAHYDAMRREFLTERTDTTEGSMAGDWIKMRTDLADDPKVVRIVSALCPQNVRIVSASCPDVLWTVGALHRVWSWFDRFTVDGTVADLSLEWIDNMVGKDGFAAAMISVGWLIQNDNLLSLPEFDRHNGATAKRRAQESHRKNVVRKMSASDADKKRPREEKRREDIYISPPTPPKAANEADQFPASLDTPEFKAAWGEWREHRKQIRKPLTPMSARKGLAQCEAMGAARAIAAINRSIANGWRGIFEDSNGQATGNARTSQPGSGSTATASRRRSTEQRGEYPEPDKGIPQF